MKSSYHKRCLEDTVQSLSDEYAVIVLTGPRQTGKTRMLSELSRRQERGRSYVSLDDLVQRELAKNDPALFLQLHPAPVFIDEIQYAPELFSQIKLMVDRNGGAGDFWLTGSQPFRLMQLAGETLAGRAAIIHMDPFSMREANGLPTEAPFEVSIDAFLRRQALVPPKPIGDIFNEIWRGFLPGLASGEHRRRDVFFSSYVQTYVERDVRDLVPTSDPIAFSRLLQAVACRIGQEVNVHEIAKDLGVGDTSVRTGLGILEKSDIIFYLHPYSANTLKRVVKSPKLYFFDTGLAAYLSRWGSAETLEAGAMGGAVFENFVVSEIRKSYSQHGLEAPLYYYRDRDGKEIDVVLEHDGKLFPIEIKKTANPKKEMAASFRMLDKAPLERGTGTIVCMVPEVSAIDSDILLYPASRL